MSSRYKPCPFCASENISMSYCSESYKSFVVECGDCKAAGPEIPIDHVKERTSGREYATDSWNKRNQA